MWLIKRSCQWTNFFIALYSPRNTSDLNEGNSAWHVCEIRRKPDPLVNRWSEGGFIPKRCKPVFINCTTNHCSGTLHCKRFPGTVQDCVGRFCQEMKKDGDLHVPSPANTNHTNAALLATADYFPLNFSQLWTCQALTLRTCMIPLHLTSLELFLFVQSCG